MSTATARLDDRLVRSDPGDSSRPSRRDLLAWTLGTGGLLIGGGFLRVFGSAAVRPEDLTAACPFPLEEIPRELDAWKYVDGSETHLDQPTTRITGSTDHVIRNYYDEMTGTALSVLVLYGPAEPVLPHSPQICYPASGFRSLVDPVDRTIRIDDQLSAVFRAAVFVKPGGRLIVRQSVYHSYRLDGVWSPSVSDRSLPRRRAGLFKVQIQRRVLDGERTDGDEPIESFLRHLVPKLESMIATATRATAHPAAVPKPGPARR